MKVSIRKFEEKDIENKVKWINDDNNNRFLHYDLPLEYKKTLSWLKKNKSNENRFDCVIEVDNKPVGLIGLLSIDYKNSKAEYYIVIGEAFYKGKGISEEASHKIIDYAFKDIGLNKLYLFTEIENIAGQKLFEKIGFNKEGLLKYDIKNRGKYVDRFIYGISKKEYFSNKNTSCTSIKPSNISKLNIKLNDNNFFIKRDDLIPISFGGNKSRKAMLFFKDIEQSKSECVVTYGSSSSNHCRVIANLCASKGLPCYIVSTIEGNKVTNNSKLIEIFGAKITYCNIQDVNKTINDLLEKLIRKGKKPYFIPGGGHGDLGTQAYYDTYQEIKDYEKDYSICFDYIFHASGTGTTQAGLECGKILRGDKKNIVGISIARKSSYGKEIIVDSINSFLEKKSLLNIKKEDVEFIDDYILDGYGDYNKDILRTIKEVLILEGIPLDTTYTGKAFWGMKDYIIKNKIRNKNILFIHTGGTPLFFDNLEVNYE